MAQINHWIERDLLRQVGVMSDSDGEIRDVDVAAHEEIARKVLRPPAWPCGITIGGCAFYTK